MSLCFPMSAGMHGAAPLQSRHVESHRERNHASNFARSAWEWTGVRQVRFEVRNERRIADGILGDEFSEVIPCFPVLITPGPHCYVTCTLLLQLYSFWICRSFFPLAESDSDNDNNAALDDMMSRVAEQARGLNWAEHSTLHHSWQSTFDSHDWHVH